MNLRTALILVVSAGSWCQAEVYLQTQVGGIPGQHTCAAVGRVRGRSALILCSTTNHLQILSWNGNGWDQETVPLPFQPTSVIVADGHNDGVDRIYAGSLYVNAIAEMTPKPGRGGVLGGFILPGLKTTGLSSGRSITDGKTRLLIHRVTDQSPDWAIAPGHVAPNKYTERCGVGYDYMLFECSWVGNKWDCGKVGFTCESPIAMNPWPRWSREDQILAQTMFIRKGDEWQTTGALDVRRNLAISEKTGRVFVDEGERILSSKPEAGKRLPLEITFPTTFGLVLGADMNEISGAFRAMAAGHLSASRQERLFACDDAQVMEFARGSEMWKVARRLRFDGRPDHLLIADLRGDGANRLYVVENYDKLPVNDRMTLIHEFTLYPDTTTVAALDFTIDIPERSLFQGASEILGDVFRSKLSRMANLAVIDSAQMRHVLAEREFQGHLCKGSDCAAGIGKSLRARVVIRNGLSQAPDGYVIATEATDIQTGRRLFLITKRKISETAILEALEEQVIACERQWSL